MLFFQQNFGHFTCLAALCEVNSVVGFVWPYAAETVSSCVRHTLVERLGQRACIPSVAHGKLDVRGFEVQKEYICFFLSVCVAGLGFRVEAW